MEIIAIMWSSVWLAILTGRLMQRKPIRNEWSIGVLIAVAIGVFGIVRFWR